MLRDAWARLRGAGLAAAMYRGAGRFLLVNAAGVGVTFLLHLFLARALGPTGYGEFAYAAAWLALLVFVAQMGLPTSTLRFVAVYRASEAWGLLRGYSRTAWVAILAASIATALVAYSALRLGDDSNSSMALTVGLLSLPFAALLANSSSALRSLKAISRSQLPTALGQPIVFGVGLLLLVWLVPSGLNAVDAMAAYVGSFVVVWLVSTTLLQRLLPTKVRETQPRYALEEWARVTVSLFFVGLLQTLRARSDAILLGTFAGVEDVGLYAAASRLAGLPVFGLTAVAAWVPPFIAEASAAGDRARLEQLARVSARATAAFVAPVSLALVVLGSWLLGLFGPEFPRANAALRLLLIGQLFNAATGPVGYFLTMAGHQDRVAALEAVSSAASFLLNLVLIPAFGIEGAAAGGAISNALRNILMSRLAWQRMGIKTWVH